MKIEELEKFIDEFAVKNGRWPKKIVTSENIFDELRREFLATNPYTTERKLDPNRNPIATLMGIPIEVLPVQGKCCYVVDDLVCNDHAVERFSKPEHELEPFPTQRFYVSDVNKNKTSFSKAATQQDVFEPDKINESDWLKVLNAAV